MSRGEQGQERLEGWYTAQELINPQCCEYRSHVWGWCLVINWSISNTSLRSAATTNTSVSDAKWVLTSHHYLTLLFDLILRTKQWGGKKKSQRMDFTTRGASTTLSPACLWLYPHGTLDTRARAGIWVCPQQHQLHLYWRTKQGSTLSSGFQLSTSNLPDSSCARSGVSRARSHSPQALGMRPSCCGRRWNLMACTCHSMSVGLQTRQWFQERLIYYYWCSLRSREVKVIVSGWCFTAPGSWWMRLSCWMTYHLNSYRFST